jgi:Uma2 family endonuclease
MFGMAIAARPAEHDETHGASELVMYDRPLTWDDLQRTPEDGLRYELVDGVLLVSPAPRRVHQRVVTNLLTLMTDVVPPGHEVLSAPVDWYISHTTVFEPDVLVVHVDQPDERRVDRTPLLVVEVLSPSTRLRDLSLKRRYYGDAGLEWYWVIDPDREKPRLTVHRLVGDRYVEDAVVVGDDEYVADGAPTFGASIVPGRLVEPHRDRR